MSKASTVTTIVGQAAGPSVKSLPKNTTFRISVVINGKSVSLGSVKSGSTGVLTLPKLNTTKQGTYTVQMINSKGVKYFVKVVLKVKK